MHQRAALRQRRGRQVELGRGILDGDCAALGAQARQGRQLIFVEDGLLGVAFQPIPGVQHKRRLQLIPQEHGAFFDAHQQAGQAHHGG